MLLPGIASAATLFTTTANNGTGGIFLEVTGINSISITSFEVYFGSVTGTPVSVGVYTRPGGYTGFTTSSVGWTLHETVSGTSAGTVTLAPVVLSTPINIGAGETLSIYLQGLNSSSVIRYNGIGGAPPQTTWGNADLTFISDLALVSSTPFAGTAFSPRTFAGAINYDLSETPEPASFALFGTGLAGLALLRRKRA